MSDPKVVCQLRRARQLAAVIAATYPTSAEALAAARELPVDGWATTARYVDIDPPSTDTAALAVELLRQRAEESASSRHYDEAEKCLRHAAAATFGSAEEDSYLRVALIHATLAAGGS